MFRDRRSLGADPFRLSTLGRLRVAVAWMNGPILKSRWLLAGLSFVCAAASSGITALMVMHGASPDRPSVGQDQSVPLAGASRLGPASFEVIDVSGYVCRLAPATDSHHPAPLRPNRSVDTFDPRGR